MNPITVETSGLGPEVSDQENLPTAQSKEFPT